MYDELLEVGITKYRKLQGKMLRVTKYCKLHRKMFRGRKEDLTYLPRPRESRKVAGDVTRHRFEDLAMSSDIAQAGPECRWQHPDGNVAYAFEGLAITPRAKNVAGNVVRHTFKPLAMSRDVAQGPRTLPVTSHDMLLRLW